MMTAPDHPDFHPLDWNIWQEDAGLVRRLCAVSDAARNWDGTDARLALYSDLTNSYSYCRVVITGRKVRFDCTNRLTVRVIFDQAEAGETRAEVLKPDGRWFDFAETRAEFAAIAIGASSLT